jgi:iodotyrosine deiodinase
VQVPVFTPLMSYQELTPETMKDRAAKFYQFLNRRRTVRQFSDRAVSREIIEDCIRCAGTAPSGAHQQPWYFVAVSDLTIKRRIREGAEAEEREFYAHRAPAEWLEALEPLGTNADKPFLEAAPWLIAVFAQRFRLDARGRKIKHYYTDESVGIATGLLLAGLHASGLVSLTHTPSPMGFLNEILGRPKATERPFMIVVAGYPSGDAMVPRLTRKPLEEIATFITHAPAPGPARKSQA